MATRRVVKTPTPPQGPVSVFAAAKDKVWPVRHHTQLHVHQVMGGIPNNPRIIEGWLRTRLFGGEAKDVQLAEQVAKTALDRGVSDDEAVALVAANSNLNGFYRQGDQLCVAGRHVKAMIKEASSIALAGGHFGAQTRWGKTSKGLLGFVAEHVMVPLEFVGINDPEGEPVKEPSGISTHFVSTFRGTGISAEEFVRPAVVNFDVISDVDMTDPWWETVWAVAEEQGLGAMRSQGYGRFVVTRWDRCPNPARCRCG